MVKNVKLLCLLIFVGSMLGCAVGSKEFESAKIYIQQDDWDKAIEFLELEVKQNPNNSTAHYYLGRGYGKKGLFDKMNEEFEASLAISKKWAQDIATVRRKYWADYYNSGANEFNRKRYEKAVSKFRTATIIDPEQKDGYKNLAISYAMLDSIEAAIETYKKVIELDPKDITSLNELGRLYYDKDEFQTAIETYQKVLQLEAGNKEAVYYIALCYDQLGEREKAFTAYEEALRANPDDVDLLFNFGRLYFIQKDYDHAIEQFKKVLAINPEDFDANNIIAMSYLSKADSLKRRLRNIEEKEEKIPEQEIKLLFEKAKKNYSEAIPYLEKAAALKPLESSIWYNLGVAYVNVGDTEGGKKAFLIADELSSPEISKIQGEYGEPEKVYTTEKEGTLYVTVYYGAKGVSFDFLKGKLVSKNTFPPGQK